MADIAGVICGALSCICGAPTCNLIDQYRNFNDDVDDLRRKLTCLTGRKQDIVSKIQVEANGGQMVKQEVKEWLEGVEEIDVEVQAFLQKLQRNKWYKRACLDKLVCRKINVVKEMLDRGSFPEGLMIERAPAPGLIFPTENLVGSTEDEIWKYLMGNKVGMIGVCGIGGVGKTTIMQHINNGLVRKGRFQKVIWVVVSYPLIVSELQTKIVDTMGKTLREKEEMRRAAELMEIMGRETFVLILDDVWEEFSLKDVGIPEPTVQNGSKVVITSRSARVCNSLHCKIVEVQPLSPEESRNLFLDRVGRDVLEVGGLEEILNSIVEECDGLPLVIVLIAGSLRGIDDIKEWRIMLDDLQQCVEDVEGMENKIFPRLKLSYDRLIEPEIQQCFLYCSLFREDYEFSREELIEGWIDEGLINESRSRQKAYDKGYRFLNKLERNYLLEKTVYWHNDDAFKMHDVVREMAIRSIGPGVGYMVRSGMKLTEVPKEHDWARDLKKVSLMANHISKIPTGLSPKCLLLSTLILSDNPNLSEISRSFFENMAGLKVLDISGTGVKALPDSISNLVNLSALRLGECRSLKYLPSLARLGALKKLDLCGARIEVVPEGMEMLISLEYLDLSNTNIEALPGSISKLEHLCALRLRRCERLKCLPSLEKLVALKKLDLTLSGIEVVPQGMEMLVSLEYLDLSYTGLKEIPTGILSKLSSLQYLVVAGDFGRPSVKIDFKEAASLRKLEVLECNFDDIKHFNYFISKSKIFRNLTTYKLLVGTAMDLNHPGDDLGHVCRLIINECDIGEECIRLPENLQILWILQCKSIGSCFNKTILPENGIELNSCTIGGCEDIEYLVELDSSSPLCCPILDKVRELFIEGLPKLSVLVRVEGVATPPCLFSNLENLSISYCSKMRKLFPLEVVQALQNLETIDVSDCDQMEEIITSSDLDASSSDKFTFTFPKLRNLFLWDLPQLKRICSVEGVMVCNSIQKIVINGCRELKRIPVQLPQLDNGQPSLPPHIREIKIGEGSKEVVQALQNLEMIEVHDCEEMEEIIASSDSDTSSSLQHFCHIPTLFITYAHYFMGIG